MCIRDRAGAGTDNRLVPNYVTTSAIGLTAGDRHNCAWLGDGTVRCWGSNSSGQIGNGITGGRFSATEVVGLTGVVEVVTGSSHSCARLADGTVRCWGSNASGQLGDGTTTGRNTPAAVPGLVRVAGLAAGDSHTCARLADGAVRCWGANANGQLGDGTTTGRNVPTAVPGLTGAAGLAAGLQHTCARVTGGAVRCWGANASGQLGDGTTTNRNAPTAVPGLAGVTELTASNAVSCARVADGTARCWGANGFGPAPAAVAGLTGVAEVAGGSSHVCARTADGRVYCWGSNAVGQIGDGTNTTRLTPVAPVGVRDVAHISAANAFTCASRNDGTAVCWGSGGVGQLGEGRAFNQLRAQYPVFGVPAAQACSGAGCALGVAAGDSHGCALRPDATVACWGNGGAYQLGDGASGTRQAAVAVAGASGVAQVVGGGDFTCARLASGALQCWGGNSYGQLGDGTMTARLVPTAVSLVTDAAEVASAASALHACARTRSSNVYCWGINSSGQLGDGSTGSRVIPTLVGGGGSPVSDAAAVAVGGAHSCAVRTGGSLWCWGYNGLGQLGDGSTTNRTLPVQVAQADAGGGFVSGVTQATAGASFTCALRAGAVLCWGENPYGQLGNGTTSPRSAPGTVPGLTDAVEVRAGTHHACARRATGAVVCWGRNQNGQLGDGTTSLSRTTPVAVMSLTDAVALATGGSFTCARRASGAVVCWGYNGAGSLGLGTATDASAPDSAIFGLP